MAVPMDVILIQAVDDWLQSNPQGKMNGTKPDRAKIKEEIVNQTRLIIDAQNALLTKTTRMKVPDRLANIQIARIIQLVEDVTCILGSEDAEASKLDLIGVYEDSGPNEGTYNTADLPLDQLIKEYNFKANENDYKEVKGHLLDILDRKHRCLDPDLVAVGNGIFNYRTKQLLPFDKNKIFLSKSHINYNPNAKNDVIHNPDDGTDWDVETWMSELSNDPEVVYLNWQVLGSVVRYLVRWHKCVFLFSRSGNSGKGTLCAVARQLCGKGSCASISLADFSNDFRLEELIRANAVIVDENDVGLLIEKAANFKAVVTQDVLQINPKYKRPVSVQPRCIVIQCVNELPRSKDKSGSFYRRQLFIPFDKDFSGVERKYIKADYLQRQDVLEYILYKVLTLMPDYYEFSEPEACKKLLEECKEANDTTRQFLEDTLPQYRWDLLPDGFLYDAYKGWMKDNCPSGRALHKSNFLEEVKEAVKNCSEWHYRFDKSGKKMWVRGIKRMCVEDPIAVEYCAYSKWVGSYNQGPPFMHVNKKFQGLERKVPRYYNGQYDDEDEDVNN